MKQLRLIILEVLLIAVACPKAPAQTNGTASDYVVVISPATQAKQDWAAVALALQAKHRAELVVADAAGAECRAALRQRRPRYVCFVAQPEEVDPEYVRRIHLLPREMDGGPFGDFLWGIVTGFTAQDALRIAQASEPLVAKCGLNTTSINPAIQDGCLNLSDQGKGYWALKEGGVVTDGVCTNRALAAMFANYYNTHDVDFLVTGGHGSPFNLELPFSLGALVCGNNRLIAVDPPEFRRWIRLVGQGRNPGQDWYSAPGGEEARRKWVAERVPNSELRNPPAVATGWVALRESAHPKVFLAAGNCLVGNPARARDSMAVTWLSAGGANQFVGYTLTPRAGAAGWGTLQHWGNPSGYNTLSEAFYLSNQALIRELVQLDPELARLGSEEGPSAQEQQARLAAALERVPAAQRQRAADLFYERDGLVLFGDPKWEARLAVENEKMFEWSAAKGGGWKLTAHSALGYQTGCHVMFLLPGRVPNPRVLSSAGLKAEATEKFVVLEAPQLEKGKTYTVVVRTGA